MRTYKKILSLLLLLKFTLYKRFTNFIHFMKKKWNNCQLHLAIWLDLSLFWKKNMCRRFWIRNWNQIDCKFVFIRFSWYFKMYSYLQKMICFSCVKGIKRNSCARRICMDKPYRRSIGCINGSKYWLKRQ